MHSICIIYKISCKEGLSYVEDQQIIVCQVIFSQWLTMLYLVVTEVEISEITMVSIYVYQYIPSVDELSEEK